VTALMVGDVLPVVKKRVTQEQVRRYADASGDHNPLHLDADFAAKTAFKRPIAHGMLTLAFVMELLTQAFGRTFLEGGRLRVREIAGWAGMIAPRGQWRPWGAGYEMRIELALPDFASQSEYGVDVDLLINETVAGRERRRGQLVTSGAEGEFVYLRGDRHDPQRLIPLVIVP